MGDLKSDRQNENERVPKRILTSKEVIELRRKEAIAASGRFVELQNRDVIECLEAEDEY